MAQKRINWFTLLTKPGWLNLLLWLIIWLFAILIYSQEGYLKDDPLAVYRFYGRWSWPNFVLFYALFIWLLPWALSHKKRWMILPVCLLALAAFILLRYTNHTLQDPEYYYGYDPSNKRYPLSWQTIVVGEVNRGTQFLFIALGLRLLADRILLYQKEQEIEKLAVKTELMSLRSQISPHFLFNAFNSIYSLSLKQAPQTPDALLKLSQMFRYVLQQNEELVPLSNELEHIQRLISFEKIRFPDSVLDQDFQLNGQDNRMMIPPLLLSKLVENCFKHGDPGTNDCPVQIQALLVGKKLVFTVTNPVGINNIPNEKKAGTGLQNLRRRLELHYPGRHQFDCWQDNRCFTAQLTIESYTV